MDQLQPQSDLQKANEVLYQQNFELSIKNQILSSLRSLYDITLATIDVNEVAQKICESIATQLGFTAALISIVDNQSKTLRPIAMNNSPHLFEAIKLIGKPLTEIGIPLEFKNNLAINSLENKSRQVTTNMLDILDPIVTQEVADTIAKVANVQTIIVYPLILGNEPIGVLNIGLPKKVDDLSRSEKETLEQLIDLVAIALDRAKLYQDLKNANTQLITLTKLKDEFVYLASHELRTPLTAIKSYAWMVLNKTGELSTQTRKYMDVVYSSTERLIHLVNDMLDLSRIESGKTQLKPSQVDITQLLKDISEEFNPKFTEKQLTLSTTCPENVQVLADKDKLQQILENLVGNSFKFTPSGGKVSIAVAPKDNQIEFQVQDTGKGIPEVDIPKLFSKFGRLENSLVTTPESGTGLGLYISKQYIELHGGTIQVTSTVGIGTTFTFTIPIH